MYKEFFTLMFESYFEYVYAYCRSRLRDKDEAMDCTQEVFLTLWRKLKAREFTLGGNPKGWLFATADRISMRYNSLKSRYIKNELLHEIPEKFIVYKPFEDVNESIDINEALDTLSKDDRKLILDYYAYGKSTSELAIEFNVSVETIQRRLSRARDRLSQLLDGELPSSSTKT